MAFRTNSSLHDPVPAPRAEVPPVPADWLRTLADSLPAAISYVDLDLIYRFTNQACLTWYGVEAESIIGRNMQEVLGQGRFEARQAQVLEALSGRHVQFRTTGRHQTLGVRQVSVDYLPHFSSAGDVVGFAIMVSDVTDLHTAGREVRSAQNRLAMALSASGMSGWELDLRTNALTHHGDVTALFGIASSSPADFLRLIHPRDRRRLLRTARSIIRNRSVQDLEFRVIRPDGDQRWIHGTGMLQRASDRTPLRLFGVSVDVTERRRTHEQLRRQKLFADSLIASSLDGICALDRDLRITVWNPAMEAMTKVPATIARGALFFEVFPAGPSDLESHLTRALSGSSGRHADHPFRTSKDETRYCDIHFSPIREEEPRERGVLVVFRETTDRKHHEQQLAHEASHDLLTGLANRQSFHDHVSRAIGRSSRRRGSHFAVLFLDLDRFKTVNDSLGHAAGDRILIEVSQRLRRCIRPEDLPARLGGDEFTILLEDIDEAGDATRIASRILTSFHEPFLVSGQEVFMNTSIGIALSSTGYAAVDEVLRDADTAMYRAKSRGRGRYEIFDHEMHLQVQERLRMETDLRHALQRGEFFLAYQPIVSLADSTVLGFEALLRWQHPELGLINPSDFIPTAEETGLIVPLGSWVMTQACQWLRTCQDRPGWPDELTISINLSPRQFRQPDLVRQVKTILDQTGLRPANVHLEITEGAVMTDLEEAGRMLFALQALGVKLDVDDFGTGHASLSYLGRFPLDRLKIDQAFVSQMADGLEHGEIVRAIVALGRSLNLDLVAEGIATDEQRQMLHSLGCLQGQGFLYASALTPDEAHAYLERNNTPPVAGAKL